MVSRPRWSRKAAGLWTALIPRGGAKETRTPDPLLAKEVLYQLSYGPESAAPLWGGQQRHYRSRENASGRFWTRTRGLCLIRAVL